ncbi:MAG: hypothetical protein PHS62_03870 [Patescibacteria group bacterium]|nr:hypothetical protein [Patescibacteria group bacterium]
MLKEILTVKLKGLTMRSICYRLISLMLLVLAGLVIASLFGYEARLGEAVMTFGPVIVFLAFALYITHLVSLRRGAPKERKH